MAAAALPLAAAWLVLPAGGDVAALWLALTALLVLAAVGLWLRPRESLLALASALLTLGAAEIALRLFHPPALRPVEKIPSPEYHHVHRPDSVMYQGSYQGKDIVVRTNEDGFRTGHSRESFRKHRRRIAVLGDSFTFGVGVAQEETFPHVLEEMLRGKDDGSVAVLNAGAISWSPLIADRLYRGLLRAYRPTDVLYVLDATDIGDDLNYRKELVTERGQSLFNLAARPEPYYGAVAQVLLGSRRIARTLRAPASVLAGEAAALDDGPGYDWYDFHLEVDGVVETNRFFIYRHPLEVTRPFFDATWESIVSLAEAVAADGAAFALVILPRFHHWNPEECPENWEAGEYALDAPWQEEMFRYFRERQATSEFPILDLLPAFRATNRFPLVFRIDPHLNAGGHAFVAELLAERLEARPRAAR